MAPAGQRGEFRANRVTGVAIFWPLVVGHFGSAPITTLIANSVAGCDFDAILLPIAC